MHLIEYILIYYCVQSKGETMARKLIDVLRQICAETIQVFVYETLLNQTLLSKILKRQADTQKDKLLGYREISMESKEGDNYHTLIRDKEDFVLGKRFCVSREELKRLDSWEQGYYRKKVKLGSGNISWVYILKTSEMADKGHNITVPSYTSTKAELGDWSNSWIHYTDVNKLGINPKQFHQDPAGIYLFPEDFKTKGTIWKEKKFKIFVTINSNSKILDLSKTTPEDRKKILDELNVRYAEEKAYDDLDTWWEVLKNHYILQNKKQPAKWNKEFRSLGYDAIFDDTGSIHTVETQMLVLNPKILKVEKVETQNIKRGQFSRLKEMQQSLSKILKEYGDVKEEPVKRYKDYIGKETRIKARVLFTIGDKNIEWEIEEDTANSFMYIRITNTNIDELKDSWRSPKAFTKTSIEYNDNRELTKFVEYIMNQIV